MAEAITATLAANILTLWFAYSVWSLKRDDGWRNIVSALACFAVIATVGLAAR